ncbi:dGTP triphosphohydrolase [Luteolibacter algae]|uniref:dGTP triphosphohydrolase n=1 Tax=Luteolibacter algae TaxID=454151 RepID=A0ABW5D8Y8_9BACT
MINALRNGVSNSFYRSFDTERPLGENPIEDYRTPFQIDRDRVLHTPAFRRLQNKTQVFWSGEYDFYRTRLTHSLEVAQIGKSICAWLLRQPGSVLESDFHIDTDLVEAICLSHDLGHPPFGHAGERTLNHLMRSHGGFEGNAQTLRLLKERIFSASRKGMNPSRAFLDGILKYKTLRSELMCGDEAPRNHFIYDSQADILDWAMGDIDFPVEYTPGKCRDAFKSVECQIMDWADDTAYSLNDLSDSVRAGFLHVEKIETWAEAHSYDFSENTPLGDLIRAIKKRRVDPFVGKRIGTYIRAARLEQDSNVLSSLSNRYKYRLVIDPEVRSESELFKRLAYEVVFLSPKLKQLEHKGSHMLRGMWEILETRYIRGELIDGQDFQLLPADTVREIDEAKEESVRARLICDYLAGMTDGYAARTYKRLFSPDFGSINDL